MSQSTPSVVPGCAPESGGQALTPAAIEAILSDFRTWLQGAAQAALPACAPAADVETIDLHTLLGQFTALRHEVNLQTKATRTQGEQNQATLDQLEDALAALQQAREEEEAASPSNDDETLRPLLKTLIDVRDVLALADKEIRRVCQGILPALEKLPETGPALAGSGRGHGAAPDSQPAARPSLWQKWFGQAVSADHREKELEDRIHELEAQQESWLEAQGKRQAQTGEAALQVRRALDSLLAGYAMSLQRLERTLEQHGLEPIGCAGETFDPEQMEVVEVVCDSGRPSGEVIDAVRPGYLWRDRVFRFAQVRVARSAAPGNV